MHNSPPGAYDKYDLGAVCIQNLDLEHIGLSYYSELLMLLGQLLLKYLLLEHNFVDKRIHWTYLYKTSRDS